MNKVLQFLKQHYEKIILSVLLLALGAAAFWLYSSVQEAKVEMTPVNSEPPPQKAWTPIDLTKERADLTALHVPPPLDLSGEHNLFSPVTWKRFPDGRLRKVLKDGAAALAVVNISPVYEYIRYLNPVGELFRMSYEPVPPGRKVQWNAGLNDSDKSRPCKIIQTNAASDGSIGLTLLIKDTSEQVNVTTNNPYKRIASYEADMRYEVNGEEFKRLHAGSSLQISEQTFKIIAITNNAVTVQDTRTTKKTTIDH